MEQTCRDAGKLGGVYFGIDSNSPNWQTHASILTELQLKAQLTPPLPIPDLLVIRFYPIGKNADSVYQWVKTNIIIPWMPPGKHRVHKRRT